MSAIASVAVLAEICLVLAAAFVVARAHTDTKAEAFTYAVPVVLAIFSVAIQAAFLLGIHPYFYFFDALTLALSVALLYRHWDRLDLAVREMARSCWAHPAMTVLLGTTTAIIFLQGFLIPPTTHDSMTYNLARVLMMQEEGRLFLENFADYRQDIFPVGNDILHFLFLRFYTDYGLATFGFLGYVTIISACFALTERLFPDKGLGKVIALTAASLTMFVYHGAMTKNDLILGAMAAVANLAAYNYLSRRRIPDLYVFLVAVCFGVLSKFTFGIMALLLVAGFGGIFVLRHGIAALVADSGRLMRASYGAWLVLPIAMFLLVLAVFAHNYVSYGGVMGPTFYLSVAAKIDGLWGGLINIARFIISLANIPPEIVGAGLTELHDQILGGKRSLGVVWWPDFPVFLEIPLAPGPMAAWYGPLGLPIFGSLIYALWKGNGYLRTLSFVALSGAVFLVVVTAWSPWHGRYYAGTMAAGLICLAFALSRAHDWRAWLGKSLTTAVVILGVANLVYLTVYINTLNFSYSRAVLKDRLVPYNKYMGEMMEYYLGLEPGSRVLVVTGEDVGVFPMYLMRPDLNLTTVGYRHSMFRKNVKIDGKEYDLLKPQDFRFVASQFDRWLLMSVSDEMANSEKALRTKPTVQ